MYCNERRITLKKEEPTLSMGQSTKKMSEEWRALDAKKKKKYEDLAGKDKERYENQMAESGQGKKKKANDGADGGPKRPLSAFFLF